MDSLGTLAGVNPLMHSIAISKMDGQTCLRDRNDDGLADGVFLLNDGNREDRVAKAIDPIPLNVEFLRNAGSGTGVSVQLMAGKTPKFKLHILDGGKPREFESITTPTGTYKRMVSVKNISKLPIDVSVYEIKIRILAFDQKSGKMKYEFLPDESDRYFPVPVRTRYRY